MVGGRFPGVLLALLLILLLLGSLNAKDFRYKHYTYRKKQRLAKKYSPLEKDCETKRCQGVVGLELTKCTRQCISQACYDELYAWDEVEDGDFSDLKDWNSLECNSRETREERSQSDRSSAELKFMNKSSWHGSQTMHQLEEGEIDVRLTSFKGCVVKQFQEQESRSRGL